MHFLFLNTFFYRASLWLWDKTRKRKQNQIWLWGGTDSLNRSFMKGQDFLCFYFLCTLTQFEAVQDLTAMPQLSITCFFLLFSFPHFILKLLFQGEVEQIAMMKPKALSEHEDGMLEFLEDIIGSNRFKQPIETLCQRVEHLNEMRAEKVRMHGEL